jgi:hypothetical protein
MYKYLIFLVVLLFFSTRVVAQSEDPPPGKIRVAAIIIDGDTMPVEYLDPIYKTEYIDGSRKQYLDRLRYNIYKVYPYVILAQNVLKKMDQDLGQHPSRRARKKYLDNLDIELNSKFKDELKDLSVNQGKILVKLINRQTGKNVYDIIKELKGGVNARAYQTAFKFVDNNLKAQYDPFGEDKDIELIVREIEAGNYFKPQTIRKKSDPK